MFSRAGFRSHASLAFVEHQLLQRVKAVVVIVITGAIISLVVASLTHCTQMRLALARHAANDI
jgi:cytochrome b subunit of formate dehydrogenase